MVCPKKQDFCPRINMLKGNFDTNYFELLMILRVFKVDCLVLTLFLVPNLRLVAKIMWKKDPYIFVLLLVQK
jgi:hypothetical protein